MLKIIIVDDESPIREWLEYVIAQKNDFQIIGSCRSAKDALDLARNNAPDVLITDIEMPGMTGLELIASVKEVNSTIKFVVLTNYADFSYAKEAIRLGTIEYLLKSSLKANDVLAVLMKIDEERKNAVIQERMDEWFTKKIAFDRESLFDYSKEEATNVLNYAGVPDHRVFQIFSMAENDLVKQIGNMRRATLETNLQYHYFQSQGYLYVIGQGKQKRELEEDITAVLHAYAAISQDRIGISKGGTNLDEFLNLVQQARCATLSGFFLPVKRMIRFHELSEGFNLNREKILSQYREMMFFLKEEKYGSLVDEVKQWYGMFSAFSSDDVDWGIEICRNLALSFEEKRFRENEKWEAKIGLFERLGTIDACQLTCEKILQQLIDTKEGRYSGRIEEALQYMHQHFDRDLSLVEVAGFLHITPEYFSRLFKEEVGSSFSTYLITHRLKKAEYLLRNTNLTVAEIAERVGYEQPSYFSRIYKKYRGITPLKTREYENKK